MTINISGSPDEMRAFFANPSTVVAPSSAPIAESAKEPAPLSSCPVAPLGSVATQSNPAVVAPPVQLPLFRKKEQPKIHPALKGIECDQYLSGALGAYQRLREKALSTDKDELPADIVHKRLLADSDSTVRERISTLFKAGLLKLVDRRGRQFFRINLLDDSDVIEIFKSVNNPYPNDPRSRKVYKALTFDRARQFDA